MNSGSIPHLGRRTYVAALAVIGLAALCCCGLVGVGALWPEPTPTVTPQVRFSTHDATATPEIPTPFAPRSTRTPKPGSEPFSTRTPATCSCASDTLNCDDFPSSYAAQQCFEACIQAGAGDVYQLDRDKDLNACEWDQ
jgi:hypothetical protein